MTSSTLVLGMHRSGTSAVTGALSHLGLKLGSNQRLMAPGLDNLRGYFEVQEISDFNESLLNQRGLTWDSVSLTPLLSFDTSDVLRARALVFEVDEAITCVKDPRISVLLPFWRSALLDRIANLVVLRDPREVVWSLVVRNGFTPVHACALWITYNALIAESASGLPNHLVFFDDVIERTDETIHGIADFLIARRLIQGISDEQIGLATKSVDPILRQITYPHWLSDHLLVTEAMTIFNSIRDSRSLEVVSAHVEANNHRIGRLCNEVLDLHRRSDAVISRLEDVRLHLGNQPIGHLADSNLDSHSARTESLSRATTSVDPRLNQAPTNLSDEVANLQKDLEAANAQISYRTTSRTYRVGRAIVWPFLCLKSFFRRSQSAIDGSTLTEKFGD
jgi:hypothetical protein